MDGVKINKDMSFKKEGDEQGLGKWEDMWDCEECKDILGPKDWRDKQSFGWKYKDKWFSIFFSFILFYFAMKQG